MSWTIIDSQRAANGGGADTITVNVSGVAQGDVVLVFAANDSSHPIVSVSDGTNNLTLRPEIQSNTNFHSTSYQVQPASPTGALTLTANWGVASNATTRDIHAWVLRASGTPSISIDAELYTAAQVGTTAVNSGNITTTGTDGIAVCATMFDSAFTWVLGTNVPTINGVSGSGLMNAGEEMASWYITYSAGFTGEGAATGSNTSRHTTPIISFKNTGGGGGTTITGFGRRLHSFIYQQG